MSRFVELSQAHVYLMFLPFRSVLIMCRYAGFHEVLMRSGTQMEPKTDKLPIGFRFSCLGSSNSTCNKMETRKEVGFYIRD